MQYSNNYWLVVFKDFAGELVAQIVLYMQNRAARKAGIYTKETHAAPSVEVYTIVVSIQKQ